MVKPNDEELYDQIINDATVIYGKNETKYKLNYIDKMYKNLGGTYNNEEDIKITGTGLPAKDIKIFLDKSYKNRPSDYGDYKVDKELSGKRVQVYHNPITDKSIVVHRGTDSIQDWGTNLAMTFGIKGKRYKHAKKIQDEAEKKYGKKNIITMGHSQGARWAELLGRDTAEVITLNKPTLPLDIITMDKVPKNQTDIKTTGDPVSVYRKYQRGNDAVKIVSGIINNPITEHKVDVLDRLPADKNIGLKNGEGIYNKKVAKKLGVIIEPSKMKGKLLDIYDANKQYIFSITGKEKLNKNKLGTKGYYAEQLLW